MIHRNGKIKPLKELAEVLSQFRETRNKIIHCHGVFDLLHIGHIRHFRQAKAMGDLLVVSVTPDRYVNKGPHRPVFNEELRAEAVAALDDVDYVTINQWPLAVETIKILKPDVYVKGPEYRETERDRTGGITLEIEAVKSVGGEIAFTDGFNFSSSNLINRALEVFPKKVSDYLRSFSSRHSSGEVIRYLEKAHSLKVLVVGEAIIDEYQYCTAIGKSSKEPMLAVKHLGTEKFAGGILAVANHVANFCPEVSLVTFLGGKNSQEDFIREKINQKMGLTFLSRDGAPTIVKRRFIESYFFTKMMELYEMEDAPLTEPENRRLCETLLAQIPEHDLVIVVDYGHGMLTKEAVDILCQESRFLALNTQSNAGNAGYHTLSRYSRADYIAVAESEIRLEVRDRNADLSRLVPAVSKRLGAQQMAVTRGSNGCLCYGEGEGPLEVPAFAGRVVDRMGAGDAFFSVTALCAAQGAPLEVIGFIGNAVGAQAVATVGHRSPIERIPLFKQIESLLK